MHAVNDYHAARDVALAQPTVHRYLNLLETSYLLVRQPAYSDPAEPISSTSFSTIYWPGTTRVSIARGLLLAHGERTRAGLLLHAGETLEWLAPDVLEVPWWGVL